MLLSSPFHTGKPLLPFNNKAHIQINSLLTPAYDHHKKFSTSRTKAYEKKQRKKLANNGPSSSSSSTTSLLLLPAPLETKHINVIRKKSYPISKNTIHKLLEDQKRANHIVSEQKRRTNIRAGLNKLVDIVSTLGTGHRTEALILQKCM